MVPFLDLKTQYKDLAGELEPAVLKVLANGHYILGDEGKAFEQEFASYLGAKHAIAVSSGLDALRLALIAAGIGPGDEVITPANTFIATALAITSVGASVVLVDPDEATSNIDAAGIERAITSRTKAIMPVHLYGLPADMKPIIELARERKLVVIEDACQAHGALVDGVKAGTLGQTGCYSFYPGKNLGAAGDGGMIVTADEKIRDRLVSLRNYGSPKKYYHTEIGYNHRLDEIQAAVLRVKLKRLDAWNAARQKAAAAYDKALAGLPLKLPVVPKNRTHIYHLYVVRTEKRDALQKHLADKGVGTIIHYPVPIHLQEAYKSLHQGPGSFPISERLAGEILSLPMFPELTSAQIEEVVAGIRSFFSK